MLLPIYRISRRRQTKWLLVLAFLLFGILDIIHISRCVSQPATEPQTRRSENIYIASLHWNNEAILRSHWNDAVISLAKELGRDNVFVTVYESGSWDDTKEALNELDQALGGFGIRRNITMSRVTHLGEISAADKDSGWVETPQGQRELRRIPFLARLRDLSLEPLRGLAKLGVTFDKVLFLNDVVFSTGDALRLLDTNGGDYAAACSLDYSEAPKVYDTFALRDVEGHEMLMPTWPYFRAKESRRAMLANAPVPVSSCWNGMVVMPAKPFTADSPLQFRGIPDSLAASHLEGSECCLIHADNPLRAEKQIFVNPQVRVGYSGDAYLDVQQDTATSLRKVYIAVWENRVRRWTTSPRLKEWIVHRKVQKWRKQSEDHQEAGELCLIDEMQVLVGNGWKHL